MLIYEVNLVVDESIAPRYSTWLREHVRDLLKLDGFDAAAWFVRSDNADTMPDGDEPDGPRQWTIHYQVRDADALQAYFDNHADVFRRNRPETFEGHVTIDRRVLQHRRLFKASEMDADTGPMS